MSNNRGKFWDIFVIVCVLSTMILSVLKLCGIIDINWATVFIPMSLPILVIVAVIMIALMFSHFTVELNKKSKRHNYNTYRTYNDNLIEIPKDIEESVTNEKKD